MFLLLNFCFLEPIHIHNSQGKQKVTSEGRFFCKDSKKNGEGSKIGEFVAKDKKRQDNTMLTLTRECASRRTCGHCSRSEGK